MSTKKPKPNQSELKSELIQRVIDVKKQLPSSGVTSLFVSMFPEYKQPAKRKKITAVLQFRSTDETIIELLEKISSTINI